MLSYLLKVFSSRHLLMTIHSLRTKKEGCKWRGWSGKRSMSPQLHLAVLNRMSVLTKSQKHKCELSIQRSQIWWKWQWPIGLFIKINLNIRSRKQYFRATLLSQVEKPRRRIPKNLQQQQNSRGISLKITGIHISVDLTLAHHKAVGCLANC